jgi:hydrogenase-4 component F
MLMSIVLVPFILGLVALAIPWKGIRRALLIIGAIGHSIMTAVSGLTQKTAPASGAWIGLDATGFLFLSITSVLFLAVSIYTVGYLGRDSDSKVRDSVEGFLFSNEPEMIFISCLLLFLASMSMVCISRDMGLLWVAIEATTLVSAPLISFHSHHRSLEATWKYLLICSVGIALALLGNYFLAYAGHGKTHLNLDNLIAGAAALDQPWLKASFLMLLVGYGTKMGMVPMHTWLPDAHSEAPSMVSALLSGALLNCAFLGILRAHSILSAAGLHLFSGELLVFFGLLSMAVAAAFMIRQTDYKRMLAYSSIEHMGILALGVGLGGLAGKGAMLHAVNHSLTKGLLFLVSGHILFTYRTKKIHDVRHVLRTAPLTGVLWLTGFLAITGAPPFGIFLSEVTILKGMLDSGRWIVAVSYLLVLAMIFIAMARVVIPMAFGLPDREKAVNPISVNPKEPVWFAGPAIAMAVAILALGLYVPGAIWNFLGKAAALTGGF